MTKLTFLVILGVLSIVVKNWSSAETFSHRASHQQVYRIYSGTAWTSHVLLCNAGSLVCLCVVCYWLRRIQKEGDEWMAVWLRYYLSKRIHSYIIKLS